MVRRASEKKTFLWCFREVVLISVHAHSPHLFILSLSPSGGVFFIFFYFCIAKLELGYCYFF